MNGKPMKSSDCPLSSLIRSQAKFLVQHRSKLIRSMEGKAIKAMTDLYLAYYNAVTARAGYDWISNLIDDDADNEVEKLLGFKQKLIEMEQARVRDEQQKANNLAKKDMLPIPFPNLMTQVELTVYNQRMALNENKKKRKLDNNARRAN